MTHEQRVNAIIAIYQSSGLKVVLEILEDIALESETALLNTDPWSEAVPSLHAVANAQRKMFSEVQRQIKKLAEDRPGVVDSEPGDLSEFMQ